MYSLINFGNCIQGVTNPMIQVEKSYFTFKSVPSCFAPVRFWGSWFLLLSLLWFSGWFRKVILPLWMCFCSWNMKKSQNRFVTRGPCNTFRKWGGRVSARISALCPTVPVSRHGTGMSQVPVGKACGHIRQTWASISSLVSVHVTFWKH